MNNKRIEYIDIAKGLLILLVVIGHVQQNEPFTLLKQFIYTFHMPAFFIISGILFDKSRTANKKFFPYVKKKIYTLIIPYFFFEILSGIVFYMAYSGNYSNIKGIIVNAITMECNLTPDWFLPTLFIVDVMAYIEVNAKSKTISILLFVLSFASMFLSYDNHYIIVIQRMLVSYVFFVVGQYLRTFTGYFNYIWCFVSLAVTTIVAFTNGTVGIYSCTYNNALLFFIGSLAGSIFILSLSRIVNHSKTLSYLGINSLVVMSTHYVILRLAENCLNIDCTIYINSFIVFVMIVVLEPVLIFVMNKFAPFLIGKSRH